MPIYAYRCGSCGHAKDVLQKISDPVLTVCPACGAAAFTKQVTAAGFQLKGSGWYVTDFRGGNNAGAKKDDAAAPADAKSGADASGADAKGSDAKAADAKAADAKAADKKGADPAAKTAAPAPSPSPAPAPAASGGGAPA